MQKYDPCILSPAVDKWLCPTFKSLWPHEAVLGQSCARCKACGHLSGDAALILCPALSQAASYSISASCRLADVQVHKLSLKPQGTKTRGVWDNFTYNKRLLKLFFFFNEYALSSGCALSDHVDLLNSKTYLKKLITTFYKAI